MNVKASVDNFVRHDMPLNASLFFDVLSQISRIFDRFILIVFTLLSVINTCWCLYREEPFIVVYPLIEGIFVDVDLPSELYKLMYIIN